MTTPMKLTYQQKLEALSLRFYQGLQWTPKAGDYYTTSRADLDLYCVIAVEGGEVKTQYCDQSKTSAVSTWPVEEFTSAGFGPKRVYVPDFVLWTLTDPVAHPVTVEAADHDLLQRAVDLIRGDLVGSEWKKACNDFVRDALRALAGEKRDD